MSSEAIAGAPPRIYYLTEEFYPPQIGGVELMVSTSRTALPPGEFRLR